MKVWSAVLAVELVSCRQQLLYRASDAPKKGSNEKRTRRSDESSVLWIWKELDYFDGFTPIEKNSSQHLRSLAGDLPEFPLEMEWNESIFQRTFFGLCTLGLKENMRKRNAICFTAIGDNAGGSGDGRMALTGRLRHNMQIGPDPCCGYATVHLAAIPDAEERKIGIKRHQSTRKKCNCTTGRASAL
jgi:hypothetical protein